MDISRRMYQFPFALIRYKRTKRILLLFSSAAMTSAFFPMEEVIILFAIFSISMGSFIPIHEVHHHSQPYAFGYSVKDHYGEQHREESGDGGHSVKGSYGFTDSRGVHRQVNYVADHGGFRAEIHTNEPGTANQDPAAVKMQSSAHNGYYGGHGIASGVVGGPVGLVGYAPIAVSGNHYSSPLHGGHVSVYDSRYSHV